MAKKAEQAGGLAITVGEFEWDESNEAHCARHGVNPSIAEQVKDGSPLFFANKTGRTGTHMMIGPDASGTLWTIIILQGEMEGRWRPITGWPSDKPEILRYKEAAKITSRRVSNETK